MRALISAHTLQTLALKQGDVQSPPRRVDVFFSSQTDSCRRRRRREDLIRSSFGGPLVFFNEICSKDQKSYDCCARCVSAALFEFLSS